jgi:hypothetical protein
MTTGFYGVTAPPEVQAADAHFGAELYESSFMLTQIPGGANHPTDYVIDEAGVVESVERVYYGGKPLR